MSIAEPQIPSLQIVAEQFRAEIFVYIQSKVADPATADDLTQETFVKVSRALAKGTMPEHLRGWLYRIARNTTIDFPCLAGHYGSAKVNEDQCSSRLQELHVIAGRRPVLVAVFEAQLSIIRNGNVLATRS
jgi:predicted RNA polymerase sigma factor